MKRIFIKFNCCQQDSVSEKNILTGLEQIVKANLLSSDSSH